MPEDMLPIYEIEPDFLNILDHQNRIILSSPTGSGKSTQIPQMLLKHPRYRKNGEILVLQPRRLSARMLAARVAWERKTSLGKEVGYQIRFDDRTSPQTRIKYITEGILLRRIMADPHLKGVSAVIFDEFHERHLFTDVSIARMLHFQKVHSPDILLLAMSATLDVDLLENYLQPCSVIRSEGRFFPVEKEYISASIDSKYRNIWDKAAFIFETAMQKGISGDTLIFMPGVYEIHRTVVALKNSSATRGMRVYPLYGDMNSRDQDEVVNTTEPKVVIATNVAETSLTIPGIRLVIDSGLARKPSYDARRGINALPIEKISRDSADQRAGRAGRTAPGYCIRLWTEKDHRKRAEHERPEIQRVEMSETLLTLVAGKVDVENICWLEEPPPDVMQRANSLLKNLGAFEQDGKTLTEEGRRMSSFPVHPRYARMFIEAEGFDNVREMALLVAIAQGPSLLVKRPDAQMSANRQKWITGNECSDFQFLFKAWECVHQHNFDLEYCRSYGVHAQNARRIFQLFKQLLRIAESEGLSLRPGPENWEGLRKCLLLGFSDHLAKRRDTGTLKCNLVDNRKAEIRKDSLLRKTTLVVAAEIDEIQGKGLDRTVWLSNLIAIEKSWLSKYFPHDFHIKTEVVYDEQQRRVLQRRVCLFRDLILETKITGKPSLEESAKILAREIMEERLILKNWNKKVEQWIQRVNFLSRSKYNYDPIKEEDRQQILEQICYGATRYKEIKDHPVWPTLETWLSAEETEKLDRYAPTQYKLPNGRKIKITYEVDATPSISIKIQDIFDVNGSLMIGEGATPLRIHILAPNFQPVHITNQLDTFWNDIYPGVKSELRKKYPKHEWR